MAREIEISGACKYSSDGLSGPPNRWENVGKSVYRKADTYVWKEDDGWYRMTLSPPTFRLTLTSIALSPLGGVFSSSSGPYRTMALAKKETRRYSGARM